MESLDIACMFEFHAFSYVFLGVNLSSRNSFSQLFAFLAFLCGIPCISCSSLSCPSWTSFWMAWVDMPCLDMDIPSPHHRCLRGPRTRRRDPQHQTRVRISFHPSICCNPYKIAKLSNIRGSERSSELIILRLYVTASLYTSHCLPRNAFRWTLGSVSPCSWAHWGHSASGRWEVSEFLSIAWSRTIRTPRLAID